MDRAVRRLCNTLALREEDYWAFEGKRDRDLTHDLFQYPAMMVPRLQRELMAEIVALDPTLRSVLDPFVGSGTILTETMSLGLDFCGMDVNPLAVLLCKVKQGPFDIPMIRSNTEAIVSRASGDKRHNVTSTFANRDKWFTRRAQVELSRIVRAIRMENALAVRRFAWVALAETIRLTSNSRTSTVKLHQRTHADITSRHNVSPISVFSGTVDRNIQSMQSQQQLLAEHNFLNRNRYAGDTQVLLKDARRGFGRTDMDLVVTSPPYGDNTTTVPYGQHAYLPLQWIDLDDIDSHAHPSHLASTHEIDARSLGGSQKLARARVEEVRSKSPALDRVLCQLEKSEGRLSRRAESGLKRVSAFYSDLDPALRQMVRSVRESGYLIITVGERRVQTLPVPMAAIVSDLLNDEAEPLTIINRRIPPTQKRMAGRNSISATMSTEQIIVLKKRAAPQ